MPTEAISGGRLDHSLLPKISAEKAESLARHRLHPNDILFARRGVQATGKTAIVRADEAGFICGTGAIRLRVKRSSKLIDPEFLACLLMDQSSIGWFKFHAIGATMPNLNEGIIKAFCFSLPPLPKQRVIAATLRALDDKTDLNRRMNETLEAMARALFKDWFVDFGPTRAKMEGREPYLAPDLWALFPDSLDEDGKPEGWEERPLTECFSIIGGGTPKTSNSAFWEGTIPWFSVTDTPPNGSVFVTDTEKTISEAGLNASSARLVPKGTTIITARGTVGNLAIAGREMTFNQSCYGLQGIGAVGNYATYLITQNMVSRLQSMAHGSVFSTITRQTFDSLSLPIPDPKILKMFEDVVSPLFNRILLNVNESRTLAQTRDLLLPKLMSGEIKVGELADNVGDDA